MRVAIAGAGIGGLSLAALLHRDGHAVELVEKARAFGEIGAGIQISPNGARILAAIGVGDSLRRVGTTPERIVLRRWDDDRVLLAQPLGDVPVARYGSAYYNVYRPDLIEILSSAVAGVTIRFGADVVGARNLTNAAALDLADGSSIEADVVVGADGIHSPVRSALFGPSASRFSGSIAYRALVPREATADLPIEVTNRLGPRQHLVSYFVGEAQRFYNLVCVVPEPAWDVEGWDEPGTAAELRGHFAGWSDAVNDLLAHVVEPVHRWALHDREPMATWTSGRVALLGDAAHPMLPFMAQGACQAIEDAAVLSRLLTATTPDRAEQALLRYGRIRPPRAHEIQARSYANATTYHLPDGPGQRRRDAAFAAHSTDDGVRAMDWLYGYDALDAPLD